MAPMSSRCFPWLPSRWLGRFDARYTVALENNLEAIFRCENRSRFHTRFNRVVEGPRTNDPIVYPMSTKKGDRPMQRKSCLRDEGGRNWKKEKNTRANVYFSSGTRLATAASEVRPFRPHSDWFPIRATHVASCKCWGEGPLQHGPPRFTALTI